MSTRRLPFSAFAVLVFILAVSAGLPERVVSLPANGKVRYVPDGDTIILETGERVRYLGIDAPETGHGGKLSQCYGKKAKEANAKLVQGKIVTFRYGMETHDQYGRLLAYVYGPEKTCVNVELVKAGYASVYRTPGMVDMPADLLTAQREAIGKRQGLWGACPVKPEKYYIGNSGTFALHRPWCPLGRGMSLRSRLRFDDRWQALNDGFHPCRSCRP